jgi:ComF family protein
MDLSVSKTRSAAGRASVKGWHRLIDGIAATARGIVDLVLPPRCPGCRVIVDGDGRFCLSCWRELTFITAPLCARCGSPFDHDRGPGTECGACLAAPPHYTTARAALVYGGPARTALLALKHGDRQHLARVMAPHMARVMAPHMARVMAPHMARAPDTLLVPDVLLVPVPLHRWRLWRRGFNQAALLAQALAKLTGVPLAVDAIVRVRPTAISRGLGRRARAANVRGAMRVPERNRVAGRCIFLIDDVLTTGATADACARVLRRAGAREVHVLTWARVVRENTI